MSHFVRQSSLAKNITQLLAEAATVSPIGQARRLIQLEKDWLTIVQALLEPTTQTRLKRQAGQIAGLQNGELIILVDSPATRTKLKLLTTELAAALRARGWQVSAIRTQVQETLAKPEANFIPNDRQLPDDAAQLIAETANSIGNVKLRHALKRLAIGSSAQKT